MTNRRTKIVATLGPSSNKPEIIREMVKTGMDVARLNFSHGSYEDHAIVIASLRMISEELGKPVKLLQDLQGPKIRVGKLAGGEIQLMKGDIVHLIPEEKYQGLKDQIPVDYPFAAQEAFNGMQILLDDGFFEFRVEKISGDTLVCKVVEGGALKSRKGVNFPQCNLNLPAVTEKDLKDLEFGLSQGIDWISLSFVRNSEDVIHLKKLILDRGYRKPVIAKIEKPQAIEHLDDILQEVQGIMVARGDLGVEMSPEKVPMLQKQIIESCNRRGIPVITATQMLESMIQEPRPTRAEASDVANAIIDGTDCIMLSGESAIGSYPIKAVEMMDKIACEVESGIQFKSYPPSDRTKIMALSESTNSIEQVVSPTCIVVLTSSGLSAKYVASERPKTPIYAMTNNYQVYHGLNLLWGIQPVLIHDQPETFEGLVNLAERTLQENNFATPGDTVLILGGIPAGNPGGTNFIKIHTIGPNSSSQH